MKVFNLATATSEEIWQDCLQERLMGVFSHLETSKILPPGFRLDLKEIIPMQGRSAHFTVLVSGQKYPLTYGFKAEMDTKNGTSFRVTPVDPAFEMQSNQLKDAYSLDSIEDGCSGYFAADLLMNYTAEVSDPRLSPIDPRVMRSKNLVMRPN